MNLSRLNFFIPLLGLLGACATSPDESSSQADRQARLVGAPVIAKDQYCNEHVLAAARPQIPDSMVRAGTNGWALLTYELTGSGRASNISAIFSSGAQQFGDTSVKAMEKARFKEGVIRASCKELFTVTMR